MTFVPIGWNVVSRDVKRDGTRSRAWCGASSRRQTRPTPSLENHAVGSFLEARAGRFTARRAKETLVFKVRGEAAVEIIKAGSEDEAVDPSLAFVESCPVRFDERAVVATVFGPGRRGNLRLRFPGSARADSAFENILFFASAFRSGRAQSFAQPSVPPDARGRKFVLKCDLIR